MEELFQRFPDLAEDIHTQFDNQSLAKCKIVSRSWNNFLNNQKLLSIRKIQKHAGHCDQFLVEWKKVLAKTSTAFIKELAEMVKEFITESFKDVTEKEFMKYPLSPLHVISAFDNLQMFQNVFQKMEDKNPFGPLGFTPLHFAAFKGHFEICQLIINRIRMDDGWTNPPDWDEKEGCEVFFYRIKTNIAFFTAHGFLRIPYRSLRFS